MVGNIFMISTGTWKAWEGRVLDGKFPLRQWLGGSDHSAVFATERAGSTPGKAAIKLIPADSPDPDRQLARWRAAQQLSHSNLIRIFEIGRCRLDNAQVLYLVTERGEEDLSQILPLRPLSPDEVGDLLPPLLDALSYLHDRGFVHGRIKPSNVLAIGDQLKLSADQITSMSEAGPMRTRRDAYDAPETAAGIASPAGDLWSVGLTLVAALTQNIELKENSSQANPGLPETLPEPFRGIARDCLRLDPEQRCSIAEIKARLQPAGRSVPTARDASPVQAPRAKRGPFAIVAVALAVLIGFFIFFYPRGHSGGKTAGSETSSAPEQPAPQTSAPTPQHQPDALAKTVSAQVAREVLPDVPRSASNTITGTIKVAVRVEVDSSGKVTSAKLTSAGPSQYFARLALKAAQGWEFSAPQVNGQAAASTWLLHFRFRRGSTQVSPEHVNR
jgi:TonB family protein